MIICLTKCTEEGSLFPRVSDDGLRSYSLEWRFA